MKNPAISADFSHDLLFMVVQAKYPDLICGKDYNISHPIDPKTGEQIGDPIIAIWNLEGEPPSVDALKAEFKNNEAVYRAAFIRKYRDSCLEWSDLKTFVPPDAPASVQAKAAAWVAYRQALRDVTNQPGFPLDVDWPEIPT